MNSAPGPSAPGPRCSSVTMPGLRASMRRMSTPGSSLCAEGQGEGGGRRAEVAAGGGGGEGGVAVHVKGGGGLKWTRPLPSATADGKRCAVTGATASTLSCRLSLPRRLEVAVAADTASMHLSPLRLACSDAQLEPHHRAVGHSNRHRRFALWPAPRYPDPAAGRAVRPPPPLHPPPPPRVPPPPATTG